MNKNVKKFLCTFLSVIMIIQVLPMTVWGAEVQNKTLPKIINADNSIEIAQKLSGECTENQSTYLAEDGSIVKSIELSENNNSQITEASVYSDASNSDGEIVIYQEDGIENELIESSLKLTTQQQEIWSEVFDNKSQTVYKNNGYNYLSSHIDSIGNDQSKIFDSKSKTPYGTKAIKSN